MNQMKQLKAGNSKSQLVRAILTYQRALAYYASDEHWLRTYEGKFTWNDSRHPTEVAKIVLGMASEIPEPIIQTHEPTCEGTTHPNSLHPCNCKSVREPDKKPQSSNVKTCPKCPYQMKELPSGSFMCTKCGHLIKKGVSNEPKI